MPTSACSLDGGSHELNGNTSERAEIGYDLEPDRQRYHVTESGVVVVVREESMIEEPE